jgi:hypothetical protein
MTFGIGMILVFAVSQNKAECHNAECHFADGRGTTFEF